jgi:hypothetical protein
MRFRSMAIAACVLIFGACSRSDAPPRSSKPATAAADPAPAATLPASVDLRPQLEELGLPPRAQGARPTCSIFTTCAALEFAIAKARGRGEPMSVEFLNWACNAATNRTDDGDFFHFALAGYDRYGLCAESAWPYAATFDAAIAPSAAALAEAAAEKAELASIVSVVWIKPIDPPTRGLDAAQFAETKRVLTAGNPIAAGAGHSRLLVGYRDDATKPGGGIFITKDSGSGAYGEVDYSFVQNEVCDAFWVKARLAR